MSLRHWEATRDRLRDELDENLMTAGAPPDQKDRLAGLLATAAIDSYTKSVYKDFKPEPRRHSGDEIFTGSYSR